MRRLLLLLTILTVIAAGAYLNLRDQSSTVGKKKSLAQTPEEMRQEQNRRKVERRAKGIVKYDGPKEFAEYHHAIRTRDGATDPEYPMGYKLIELDKARQRVASLSAGLAKGTSVLPWMERGPGNVGGRTRSIIIDPDDATKNTWFAAGISGGVWKTTDAGLTWTEKTADLPNIAVATMAMAPSNRNIMYAGTGEGFFNIGSIRGDGIFKSTDRGESWTQLASTLTSDFFYVNRIIVDPSNPDILLAATGTGIFRSVNGGTSWGKTYPEGRVLQIEANPLNFATQFAAVASASSATSGGGVLKSTDGGVTWTSLFVTTGGRMELAISPSDTNRVYVAVDLNTSSELWYSENGGRTFLRSRLASGTIPHWLGGQGWYDNTIAVKPDDENTVYVGGIDMWRVQMSPQTNLTVQGVDTVNIGAILNLVTYTGNFFRGLGSGLSLVGSNSLDTSEYISMEFRFGPGRSQKAARFTATATTKVPDTSQYVYQDYVTVPFEVWDLTNNRQLMVSFRDHDNNGVFDLVAYSPFSTKREYVSVHAIAYNADLPHASVGTANGIRYKSMYAMFSSLAGGTTWDPGTHPNATITISYGEVLAGIITISRMSDAYGSSGAPRMHPDHHYFAIAPLGGGFRIVNGNDGGVIFSDDGGVTWTERFDGYTTTQFYGVDKRHGADRYVGGMQDNGTWRSPADPNRLTPWIFSIGGDGYETSWHYDDSLKIIGGFQYNGLRRTTDGGSTWSVATTDMADVGSSVAPFITKIAKSNSDPDLLFAAGATGIWRSDNFGENWTSSPLPGGSWAWNYASRAKISLANPQIVWASTRLTSTGRIFVSTNGGLSFGTTVNYGSATLGLVSGFATHPIQDSTAYALFSVASAPKILRTTNLGGSWSDISGYVTNNATSSNGFPNVAVYSLVVMPHNPNELWAGTDIGIFISTDNGGSWQYSNNGIPAVAIWQMSIVDDEVVVATYGRGIWTVAIPELATHTPPVVTKAPRLNKMASVYGVNLDISVSLRSAYDSTHVAVDGVLFATLPPNAQPKDTVVRFPITQTKTLSVGVTAYKDGQGYSSANRGVQVTTVTFSTPQNSFVDNLNFPNSNFVADGMTRTTPENFSSMAFHSPHPYQDAREYLLLLTVPIIVKPSEAFLRYDNVALVEPGESGSVYGDEDFWDYVVVEGSKDRATWVPIAPGYDARKYTDWLTAYNASQSGTSTLIKKEDFNLLNAFTAGDTIIIRFRMFADPFVNGWGWMIDNVEIQGSLVGVADNSPVPTTFELGQNFPNPFNPMTSIRYSVPGESHVTLKVYDLSGREVATVVDDRVNAGTYTGRWDATGMSSGVYFYRMTAGTFTETRKLVLMK